mmetsp:Transcript_5572/g.16627  ORF Transcript_5572/g.16627 Transcript_5572/m.16627 type:complete len:292 (-) Transcript_5572:988-1863(-)
MQTAFAMAGIVRKRRKAVLAAVARVKVWNYPSELVRARLDLREKRFLAHCTMDDLEEVTAHCPNPGAMLGLNLDKVPQVMLSKSSDPKRKLPWTLEMIDVNGTWVGCNTMLPNRVVAAALKQNLIAEVAGYTSVRAEVRYGTENSRIDFVLKYPDASELFLEVKNVTLRGSHGDNENVALFPDCKTVRGQRHLRELIGVAHKPATKAAVLYYINRTDVDAFAPCQLDQRYYTLFYEAIRDGVRALPYVFEADPHTGNVFMHPQLLPVLPEEVLKVTKQRRQRKPRGKPKTS